MDWISRQSEEARNGSGGDEPLVDGDSMGFVVSLVFHLCLLIVLALVPLVLDRGQVTLNVVLPPIQDEPEQVLELPQEFHFDQELSEEIGADSINGEEMAISLAPVISETSEVPAPEEIEPLPSQQRVDVNQTVEIATGLNFNENLAVKGSVGQAVTGAVGAIDRITHEILLSLEERKTLVVWLFDQSGSLDRQRAAIRQRFDRIYEQLGVIEASGNAAFSKHADKPLLTSVVAFGQQVRLMTDKPTDDLAEIKRVVEEIPSDPNGIERVFSAVYMAADEYKSLRVARGDSRSPERNVMLVVFTDEVGDDQQGLEESIKLCRRYAMPVYVVGVPAPFGRRETLVKWVDPDPQFDQTPRWGEVNQGPESMLPERVKIHFGRMDEERNPIDSGFGPFALTRLCYQTGGIYFAVHPNRNVNRAVSRRETAAYSAHLEHFFDPTVMKRYRPDYVSTDEYRRRLDENKARWALIQAAQRSWLTPMESPRTRFVVSSEAEFGNDLSEAQRQAAKLEPKIALIHDDLKLGEADRQRETSPRWQAGYDLAMGRVLAVKTRTEGYNAMLAKAKRGMKFENARNNTWTLKPADEISVGSALEKSADRATEYLRRVVEQHPNTPWALLAARELERPVGWKWDESFTDLSPRRNSGGGGGNNNPPANDRRRMLPKPPPKRPVPKL